MNGGLKLFGEVVGIGHEGDVPLTVELLEGCGAAAVVLRLGDGTGHDTDVDGLLLLVRKCSLGSGVCGREEAFGSMKKVHHDLN